MKPEKEEQMIQSDTERAGPGLRSPGQRAALDHIDEFKRFAAVYLSWAFANFDRIVREAIARQRD